MSRDFPIFEAGKVWFLFLANAALSWQYLPLAPFLMWNVLAALILGKPLKRCSGRLAAEEMLFLLFLANMLVGGKQFAYVGFAPLFVNDLFLVLIGGIILVKHMVRGRAVLGRPAAPYLILFLILFANAVRVLILDADHGLDAFRDSVIVFYGLWAAVTVYLLRKTILWPLLQHVLIAAAVFSACHYLYKLGTFLVLKQLPGFEGFRFGAGYIVPSLFVFFLLAFKRRIGGWSLLLMMVLVVSNLTLFHRSIHIGFLAGLGILCLLLRGRKRVRVFYLGGAALGVSLLSALAIYLALGFSSAALQEYVQSKLSGSDGNISYRNSGWGLALDKFHQNPLLGYGVGLPLMYEVGNIFFATTDMSYFEIRDSGGNAQIHNSPLNFLVRYGLLGFAVLILLFLLLIHQLAGAGEARGPYAPFALACLAYMLIYSFFNVVWEGPHDGSIFWIVVGFALSVAVYAPRLDGSRNRLLS